MFYGDATETTNPQFAITILIKCHNDIIFIKIIPHFFSRDHKCKISLSSWKNYSDEMQCEEKPQWNFLCHNLILEI